MRSINTFPSVIIILAALVFSLIASTSASSQSVDVSQAISALAWHPDGTSLAVGHNNGELEIINFDTSQTSRQDYGRQITALDWSPTNSDLLAFADIDGSVSILNTTTSSIILNFQAGLIVYDVAWRPQGDYLAVSISEQLAGQLYQNETHRVDVWDSGNGTLLEQSAPDSFPMSDIDWNQDGSKIVSASGGSIIVIWDVFGSTADLILRGHTAAVTHLAWSPDNTQIASTSVLDNTLRFWDAADGDDLATITFERGANYLDWSSNGLIAVKVGLDGIYIIDGESRQTLYLIQDLSNITALAWSPDGEQLAFAGQNNDGLYTISMVSIDDLRSTTPTSTPGPSLTPPTP